MAQRKLPGILAYIRGAGVERPQYTRQVDTKGRLRYREAMILLIQDDQLDEAAPTPAAKFAYTQAVREACVDLGIQFRPAVDGDVIEQRMGAIGTPAHVPAVYLGSFLRWLNELGTEAASDAAAVPMWDESVPMKVSAWEGT